MIVTPVTYPINLRPPGTSPRTPGIHLSGVLRPLAQAAGLLEYEEGEPDLDSVIRSTPQNAVGRNGQLMRIVMGYAWEDYLIKQLELHHETVAATVKGFVSRPGELFLDGIIGTPDGIVMELDGSITDHSIKWTFCSTKKSIQTMHLYLWQSGCFLKMLSELTGVLCLNSVFHICHIRGDYKGINPQYVSTHVQFAPAEIEGYWSMVQRSKHLATPEN